MVCVHCGRDNSEQAAYCIDCGRRLQLICRACDMQNPADARYCSACGTALDDDSAQANGPSPQSGFSLCPRCGSVNDSGSLYCAACGLPLDEASANVSTPHVPRRRSIPAWELGRPAGFWIRAAARMIEGITLIAAGVVLAVLLLQQNYFDSYLTGESGWTSVDTLAVLLEVAYMTILVGAFAGTVGKLLLGMRVVRTNGSRVGYPLAFARYIAQYLSLLLLGIGYLIVAFRQDKRGLHDLICDTVVILKRA